MKNKFKMHAPMLSVVLSLLAVGYSFAANVVVVPLGADTPSGAVVAFNRTTCPGGWRHFTEANNRFLFGSSSDDAIGTTGGTTSHNHKWAHFTTSKTWFSFNSAGNFETMLVYNDGIGGEGSGYYPIAPASEGLVTYFTQRENHIPSLINVRFCEKA